MELRLHMVSHTGEMPYKVSSACLWRSFEWLLQPGAAGSRSRMPFYSGQPGPAGRCCTGGCGSARGWFFSLVPAFPLVPELITGSLSWYRLLGCTGARQLLLRPRFLGFCHLTRRSVCCTATQHATVTAQEVAGS